jgi:hypothetical protein
MVEEFTTRTKELDQPKDAFTVACYCRKPADILRVTQIEVDYRPASLNSHDRPQQFTVVFIL